MSDATSAVCGRDRKKSKQTEDKNGTKKQLRKVGEKLRRDKLKSYLSGLAQEIPWISGCNHRVDRSQILKLTVNYLRFHHGVREKRIAFQKWKPNFLTSDTLRQCLSEATGGFVMVVAHTGNVVFVSESISSILGHSPVNVIGVPISNILHDEDCEIFSRQFQTGDRNVSVCEGMPSDKERVPINSFKSNHRSFMVRMQIMLENSNNLQHEAIHVLGKISTEHPESGGKPAHSNGKTWLMAVGRPVRNRVLHELSVMGLDKLEWCSQHSMDGTVLFTDQRISQCLGVFSGESAGNSCYRYIVPEDIQAVSISHMKIMTDDEVPQTIFRLQIPNQATKYIMSRSVIVRDSWSKEAKFISSINIIIDKTEGDQLLEEQKKKVDALIAVTNFLSLQEDPSRTTAQREDRVDNSSVNTELSNEGGTSKSPNNSDRDSNGSTTSLFSSDVSPTENRSSTGSMKFGTPLLKSLLVGDVITEPNTPLTGSGQDNNKTSPISIRSHSISSCSPQPCNSSPEISSVYAKIESPLNKNSPQPCDGENQHATGDKTSPHFINEADGHLCNIGETSHVYYGSPNINPVGSSEFISTSNNISKDLFSRTSDSCGQDTPAMFSLQKVRNWTASLPEVDMELARNTELGDSPGECSNLSNQNCLHSNPDRSSPTGGSHATSKTYSDQPSLWLSNPGSVQPYTSTDQFNRLSSINLTLQPDTPFYQTGLKLSSSTNDQRSLQHSNLSNCPPHPIPSSLTCQSRLPISQTIPAQPGSLCSKPCSFEFSKPKDAPKLSLSGSHTGYESLGNLYTPSYQLEPSLSLAKSGLEEQVFACSDPCSDQSSLPLHSTCPTHSRTITRQQSSKLPNSPPSILVRQQPFREQPNSAELPDYNQHHFKQAYHPDNGMNLLTNQRSSSDNQSEQVVNQLSDHSLHQGHHAQSQSESSQYRCEQQNTGYGQMCRTQQEYMPVSVQGNAPQELDPIRDETGFSSTKLSTIDNDNSPVIAEDLNSSSSQYQEVKKSTDVLHWKNDAVHLELAGQLHAKHKQLDKLLGVQESVLNHVQGNVSLFMDTQTNDRQNGTRILQDVLNLQASVQEQKMQLSNIESEFMAKVLDTT